MRITFEIRSYADKTLVSRLWLPSSEMLIFDNHRIVYCREQFRQCVHKQLESQLSAYPRSETGNRIVGDESPDIAIASLAKLFKKNQELENWTQKNTIPLKERDRLICIFECSRCNEGWLHCVGQNKLPDGRIGMGATSMCDLCGHVLSCR